MKSKALLTAVLLAATNFAWAQGGVTVDNFEQNYADKIDTNYVIPFSSDNSYVDVTRIGKPSTGPAYRGQSSSDMFVFDLNELGKPSSGPAYRGAS